MNYEIESIEEIEDVEMVDIQVSGNHLFYANGILTHNSAIEAEQLNQAHIQGGISKINTSDYVVGIKQTDLMRSQGEIWFQILKSRNSDGVGQKILLAWDQISLLVTTLAKSANLAMTKKPTTPLPTSGIGAAKKDTSILTLFNTGE